jgi:alanine racemase
MLCQEEIIHVTNVLHFAASIMNHIMNYKFNRAWAEVDLDNIAHNVREIRRITDKHAEVMAVVKADAYGHGVMMVVETLLQNGATRLAVSMLDEAIQLRRDGISAPILVLNYTDPVRAEEIIRNDVTQTVFSHDLAEALSKAAVRLGRNIKIHVKIDTGMSRVGFMPGYSAVKDVMRISRLPRIIVEGIFTHFASADEKDRSYTYMQFERFMGVCSELERVGLFIPLKHVANSAAIIEYPEMHLNMVRAGIILYGMYPSEYVDKSKITLKPAMTLKANVILVKEVEEGTCISYGRTFTTQRRSRIATIPIGYADGFSRLLSGKARVLINGESAPIVGRICMDQCMADISELNNRVDVGDEVVIVGHQGNCHIDIEQIASAMGTINYEAVCIIGKRIPRVYLKDGKVAGVLNYLIS